MEIKKRNNLRSITCCFTAVLFLMILCGPTALSQTLSKRTVSIKIAAANGLNNQETLRLDVRRLISDACKSFKMNFDIIFKIQDFVFWEPEAYPPSMKCYLNDLRTKVQKGNNDIVLGIVSNSRSLDVAAGLTIYKQGYIILKDLRPMKVMLSVLLHELCHMFGAVDIYEKQSIMNIQSLGSVFDDFTKDIILINKNREFSLNNYPLSKTCLGEAIKLYKGRTDLNKGEADLHMLLADFLLSKQELKQALVQCYKAMELKPELMEIHILIGNIHLRMGEAALALNAYKKALLFQPQIPEIYFNIGLTYTQAGMIEEAISAYHKAIELNPFYFDAHANMGYLYLRNNKPNLAMESCQRALEIVSDSPETLTTLGAAYILLSGYNSNNGTENEPASNIVQGKSTYVVDIERREDLIKEAVKRCQQAISLNSYLPESHNVLGVALAYVGDIKGAENEFRRAVELRPNYFLAHFNLGVLYFQDHHLEESAAHFARAVAIDPDFAIGYQILAEVYHLLFLEYDQEARIRGLVGKKQGLSADFLIYGRK